MRGIKSNIEKATPLVKSFLNKCSSLIKSQEVTKKEHIQALYRMMKEDKMLNKKYNVIFKKVKPNGSSDEEDSDED